jgi:hypothetical protein
MDFRIAITDFEIPNPEPITDKQAKYISSLYVSNKACRIIQDRYLKVFQCETIWQLYKHEAQEMLSAMIRKNNQED